MPHDVHIVVPTMGDRAELLDISITSLRDQSYPCRVTIVVGGSPETVESRFGGLAGVSVVRQRGRGLSAAINQAWTDDEWQSDFTGWLGDDDALPPWSVTAALEALTRRPSAPMVHGRCLIIDESGRPVRVLRGGWLAAALVGYGMNLLAQPGSLFKTKCVRDVGGLDESLRYSMDVDLYNRLRRLGRIASTRSQLGVFRAHAAGLSTAGREAAEAEVRSQQRAEHPWLDAIADPACRAIWHLQQAIPKNLENCWRPPV